MKIQDKLKKHEPFDVASGLAAGLLATGDYVQVFPEAKAKPVPNLQWAACEGAGTIDYQAPPYIYWRCTSCGQWGGMKGPTVHITQSAHCGCGATKVPQAIADKYVRMLTKYKSRSRRKAPLSVIGTTSAEQDRLRDAAIARALGMKPKEVLQAELRQQMEEAALRK